MARDSERMKGTLLKLFKNTLVVIVIVLLIGISIGVAVTYEPAPEKEVKMTAVATATPTVVRVGEVINLSSAECTGDIVAYEWDFGDGTTSTDPNPTHAYEEPGWYNVTLVVKDKYDYYTKSTTCVGIQREDFESTEILGVNWELRPRYLSRRWDYSNIAPNIGNPTSDVFCNLENAVGTFEFEVMFWVDCPVGGWDYDTVYSTLEVGQGGQLEFACTIDPDDLPKGSEMCWIEIEFTLTIREGVFTGGEWGIIAEYPIEGLTPPY